MANISNELAQILSARYGKDVRKAIHDSIEKIDQNVAAIDPTQSSTGVADATARQMIAEETERATAAQQANTELISVKADAQHTHTVSEILGFPDIPEAYDDTEVRALIPTKVSQLTNDSGYINDISSTVKKPLSTIPANYVPTSNGSGDYSWQPQQGSSSGGAVSYDDTEIRSIINGKADASHTHTKSQITDLPQPYNDAQVRNLISGKASVSHTHTKSEITDFPSPYDDAEVRSLISGKADASHTHDDRYYTETEIDTKLNKKAAILHNHSLSEISDMNDFISVGYEFVKFSDTKVVAVTSNASYFTCHFPPKEFEGYKIVGILGHAYNGTGSSSISDQRCIFNRSGGLTECASGTSFASDFTASDNVQIALRYYGSTSTSGFSSIKASWSVFLSYLLVKDIVGVNVVS